MDDLQFLFILLKLVIMFFVHQQREEGNTALAQKGLIFTQVVAEMQSNCSCLFRAKPDKEIPNMLLFFYQINGYIHFNDTLHHHNAHNSKVSLETISVRLTRKTSIN